LQLSEVSCRQEVIAILEQGHSTLPFRYRITWPEKFSWSNGITGFSGIFVPPKSLYQKWEGYPGHGAGLEFISIAGAYWGRSPFIRDVWEKDEKRPMGLSGTVSEDWDAPIQFNIKDDIQNKRSLRHIGYASCPPETTRNDQKFLAYEYDIFKDEGGARKIYAHRAMLADPLSRLPVRFEDQFYNTEFSAQEMRQYDQSLRVDAPG
jgi:hypothetical protein